MVLAFIMIISGAVLQKLNPDQYVWGNVADLGIIAFILGVILMLAMAINVLCLGG